MEAFAQFVPLILIFAIMYFLLIRPQQRKLKDHKKMVESLRRGDMVVTQGGLIGKVTKVKEDNELGSGVVKRRAGSSSSVHRCAGSVEDGTGVLTFLLNFYAANRNMETHTYLWSRIGRPYICFAECLLL